MAFGNSDFATLFVDLIGPHLGLGSTPFNLDPLLIYECANDCDTSTSAMLQESCFIVIDLCPSGWGVDVSAAKAAVEENIESLWDKFVSDRAAHVVTSGDAGQSFSEIIIRALGLGYNYTGS